MRTTRAKVGSPAWKQAKAEGRAVYCGRACHRSTEPLAKVASDYCNSFTANGATLGGRKIENRDDVIWAFRHSWHASHNEWLRQRARRELKGKVLGCFCEENEPCHCDVIIEDIEMDGE